MDFITSNNLQLTTSVTNDEIEIEINDGGTDKLDDLDSSISLTRVHDQGQLWSIMIYVNEQSRGQRVSSLLLYHLMKEFEMKAREQDIPMSLIRIGIDTDASEGYWKHLGFKTGRYSIDGDRYNSRMADGMEAEITAQQLYNFAMNL